ncbi:MAG TPA: BON domain-containing protein, partial [Methylomirabilota bacterium]|nr:BON domain-containing protein [Methylomirabilota bacterium]
MRARRAVVGGLVAMLLASGCSLAGRSVGQFVDDKAVTAAVKLRLAARRASNLTRVNVDTFEGVVYLSGAVDSALDKSDAEIAAWGVHGVGQVVNDLQVPRDALAAASPAARPRHPLLDRLPGIVRVDAARPGA